MRLFGPLARSAAITGLLVSSILSAAPVQAAKEDIDLLQSYLGSWKGRGQVIGAEKESVVCTLKLSRGNQEKINYSGRCALAGTTMSVAGTLAYNDSARRYEAAMTSNATFSGTAVGKKQGDGVVFNLKDKAADADGNAMNISATVALLESRIHVNFDVVFNKTGESMRASIPFSK